MSNKIALLMFAATVILASTAIMTIPQASALTKSNMMTSISISTASYGNSLVCGDHKCTPGEHTKWVNAVWQSQKISYGKVRAAPHGEDVLTTMADSNLVPKTMDANTTMSDNMKMSGNSMTPAKKVRP